MIEACKKMLSDDVAFVIVGTGEMAGELHKLADNVPNLYFTGWLISMILITF